MDLTQGSAKEKRDRSRKMLLWFGMVSLIMGFAGWTSAYIVSSKRDDWQDLELPSAFFLSTVIIILSSITYIFAKRATQKDRYRQSTIWLLATLVFGITFVVTQFYGFSQMISNGYYFTGPTSTIKMSYVFLIAAVHIAHLVAGMISLLVVIYNQIKRKYSSKELLGLELGASFWHFLGVLWVYLIIFMSVVK